VRCKAGVCIEKAFKVATDPGLYQCLRDAIGEVSSVDAKAGAGLETFLGAGGSCANDGLPARGAF
jgi:hypothetical protein